MTGLVCFADEAGVYVPCNCLCVAIVCFYGSIYSAGRDAAHTIAEMLGWRRGELKWRSVKKAARRRGVEPRDVIECIASHAVLASSSCAHLESRDRLSELKEELVARLLASSEVIRGSILVVDEGLVRGDSVLGELRTRFGLKRARFASSAKAPGLQLADLLAGFAWDNVIPPHCLRR